VGDHGGVVEYDSEPGATVFRLMLPAAQQAAQQAAQREDQEA
jgi:nitrogen-specific signal transduction histidine kinase